MKHLILRFASLHLFMLSVFIPPAFAVNGGEDVSEKARAPFETTGATVWPNGPHLIEPCTAVLMCENVLLTVAHCANFNPAGDVYFTLVEDINKLDGKEKDTRYERIKAEYARKDQTKTAKVDLSSVKYGEFYRPGVLVGLAMLKLKTGEKLSGLSYPNIIPDDFRFKTDKDKTRDIFNPDSKDFLKPGGDATKAIIAGYGDAGKNRAGAGKLKKGNVRFLSWLNGTNLQPQAHGPVDVNKVEAFFFQFTHGQDGNAHGCPGDSGGPVVVEVTKDAYALAGNLEIISDLPCTNELINRRLDHYNDNVSLSYAANRKFVSDYMTANCSDKRTVDIKTGKNDVTKDEEKKDEEKKDETLCVTERTPELSEAEYVKFLSGWIDWVEQAPNGLKVDLSTINIPESQGTYLSVCDDVTPVILEPEPPASVVVEPPLSSPIPPVYSPESPLILPGDVSSSLVDESIQSSEAFLSDPSTFVVAPSLIERVGDSIPR